MSYEIKLDQKVDKFLDKLPKDIALRIINKFKQLRENPFRYLEHFEGKDVYKLRIGDYRALIDIEKMVLRVRILDKRGRIYKR